MDARELVMSGRLLLLPLLLSRACSLALAPGRRPVRALVSVLVLVLVTGIPGPASAADLFDELRKFPGVVLLPLPEAEPFDGLVPWRVEMNRPSPGSTAIIRGRYLVQYRDRERGPGAAQIGGTTGRDELDQTVEMLAALSFARCAADAAYCAENVAGRDDTAPASEVFRGLTVNDSPAVMEHVTCCGGHYWSLTWYDAPRDMTYVLVLVGPVADRYGTTISPDNRTAAASIVAMAAGLVPLE
jgi:hypothetical protein